MTSEMITGAEPETPIDKPSSYTIVAIHDLMTRRLIQTMLAATQSHGVFVESPVDAIAAINAGGCHALLVDMDAPQMNPLTLVKAAKDAGLAVIGITDSIDSAHRLQFTTAGMTRILQQPVSLSALIATIAATGGGTEAG